MWFKLFSKTFGKIKNENDMLGFLIANMDSNKDVDAMTILNESGVDNVSCNTLVRSLENSHYIIYATDVITVSSLGENNYKSPLKQFLIWLFKAIIFTSKTVVAYISGIASVVIAELIILAATRPESVEEFLSNIVDLLYSLL